MASKWVMIVFLVVIVEMVECCSWSGESARRGSCTGWCPDSHPRCTGTHSRCICEKSKKREVSQEAAKQETLLSN